MNTHVIFNFVIALLTCRVWPLVLFIGFKCYYL